MIARMVRSALLAAAVLVFAVPQISAAVAVGDSRDDVITALGQPSGAAEVGSQSILFYDRGEVKLREGRVVAVNLISEEELAARRHAEAQALERMEAAAQARLERLTAEGRATYAAKKTDARFAALPAAEQLGYWRTFATRYPMINIDEELAALTDRVNYEMRLRELQAAHEAEIAQLAERVEAAEEQAARAEREARRDRYVYPGYGYGRPRPGYPHRPPPRQPERQMATPPAHPADAARAEAMAEAEEARRRIFNGDVGN